MDNEEGNSSTPVDSIIDQVKTRILSSRNSSETRRLTVTTTGSHQNLDQQIADLEDMIKALQEELVELSKNHPIPALDSSTDVEATQEVNIFSNDLSVASHVYPIIVRDINWDQQSNAIHSTIIQSVKPEDKDNVSTNESYIEIRKNFAQPQETYVNHVEITDRQTERLIEELKSEINEKLKSLKDVDIGKDLNDFCNDFSKSCN